MSMTAVTPILGMLGSAERKRSMHYPHCTPEGILSKTSRYGEVLSSPRNIMTSPRFIAVVTALCCWQLASAQLAVRPVVLHAARVLDIESGRLISPGEVLVQGDRIAAV